MSAFSDATMWRSLAIKGLVFVGAGLSVVAMLWQTPAQSMRPQGTLNSPEPLIVQAAPLDRPQVDRKSPPSDAVQAAQQSVVPPVPAVDSKRGVSVSAPVRSAAGMGARAWREPLAKLHVGSEKLDVNRATEQDFERLPGIGSGLAKQLVAYRTEHGAYHTVEELRQVKGIGVKRFERLSPFVTVTASPARTQSSDTPVQPAGPGERERHTS